MGNVLCNNKKLDKKYRAVIEELGWQIDEPIKCGRTMLAYKISSGELITIYVDVNNIVNDIDNYDYDPEEYIYTMLQTKRSGNKTYNIPDVFTLCEYAKEIENIIYALKLAINIVNNKIYE